MPSDAPVPERRTRPVIAFSNRLPVIAHRGRWRAADGGLVPVVRGVLEARQGTWVGWDGGGTSTAPTHVEGINADLVPVVLDRTEISGHYRGFANQTLWPLLHDGIRPSVFNRRWWDAHLRAIGRFAAAGEARAGSSTAPPVLWVNDYHLMLLPNELRRRCPGSPVGFFLHTPFPPASVFARLPWRRELLSGVVGADLIGFQTPGDANNFCDAALAAIDGLKVDNERVVTPDGRSVVVCVRGVSIDAARLTDAVASDEVDSMLATLRSRFQDRILVVGIDRLDYTKGILERLLAVEDLLGRRADLRSRMQFVQIGVPTRERVHGYRDLRAQVEREVGRINGRFTRPGGEIPIRYLHRQLPLAQVVAYMLAADVMVVTPLKDGMNLVAKEFVTVQAAAGGTGALVLSEFAGAANDLGEAIMCNPFDIEGQSAAIERAIQRDVGLNRAANSTMGTRVAGASIRRWGAGFLSAVERAHAAA